MTPGFCCKCNYWENIAKKISGDDFGICSNNGVAQNVAMDGKTHLAEEGTLWTSAYFGCIYFRKGRESLVDTTKHIK